MTDALTLPPIHRVSGSVTLPGSKSMTNRALLLAAVAEGETRVTNILLSDDTQRMLDALAQLNVQVDIDQGPPAMPGARQRRPISSTGPNPDAAARQCGYRTQTFDRNACAHPRRLHYRWR